jgi:hypothetical protein
VSKEGLMGTSGMPLMRSSEESSGGHPGFEETQ